MPLTLDVIQGFIIGISASYHCIAMCGGITSSIALTIPHSGKKLSQYVFSYNFGRIFSYTIAGIIAGIIGSSFNTLFFHENGIFIVRIIASITLLTIGFSIAGWLPKISLITKITKPINGFVSGISKRINPGKNLFNSFLFGSIWGFLPCGMVYSTLIFAITTSAANEISGAIINGAFIMLAFGVGTLPSMIITALFSKKISEKFSNKSNIPIIRMVLGSIIIILAILSLLFSNPILNQNSGGEMCH